MLDLEEYQDVHQKYGHWVVLGISLTFIFYMIVFGGIKKEKGEQENILQSVSSLEKEIIAIKIPKQQKKDYFSNISHNWEQTYTALPGVNSSVFYPQAKFKFTIQAPPTKETIMPPKNLHLQISREAIELDWQDPEPLKNAKLCEIAGFILVKTQGQQKQEIFLPWGTNSYVDTKVEEGEKYSYKICCFTSNIYAQNGFKTFYQSKQVVASSFINTKEVELPSLYKAKLLGVSRDVAILQLQKWYKGDWYKTTCSVLKENFVRKKIKTKGQIIDFNPNWLLKDLTTRYPRIVVRDRKVFVKMDEFGAPIYRIERIKIKTFVCAVRYANKKGQIKTLVQKK